MGLAMAHELLELKSNRYVLTLILDPDADFQLLLQAVAKRFKNGAKFFGRGQMALQFKGRELSEAEQCRIVDTVTDNCSLEIICIIEENEAVEDCQNRAIAKALTSLKCAVSDPSEPVQNAVVLKKSLPGGQKYASSRPVVLLGDLGPSAEISSDSWVLVAGTAMGTIHAGASGDERAFLAALVLKPFEISIAGHRAVSGIRKKEIDDAYTPYPQAAYFEDGHLQFAQITPGMWERILGKRADSEKGD